MNRTATESQTAPAATIDGAIALDAAIAATERNMTLTERAAEVMGVPAESVVAILRSVWTVGKDEAELTQSEMFVGIGIVAKYGLDPIAREIYVTRNKGKMMTIIGIDGWVKILDRTEHYDGYEIALHEDDKGVIDYVDATIHSKTRTYPSTYRAFRSEYSKLSGFMWSKIPTHMLRLFAIRHAARLFVPLGGTVMLQEEADFITGDNKATRTSRVERVDIDDVIGATEEKTKPEPETKPEPKAPAEQFEQDVPETKAPDSFALKGGDK